MAIKESSRHIPYVVQESDGVGGNTSPSATFFIPEGANFRAQINPVGEADIALALNIAYHSGIYLHGSLADIRRLSELIRTTLDEWEGR